MKVNNIIGIMETFAAVPSLKKVHIISDGRHFFNEEDAKHANGVTTEVKDKKAKHTANKVEYKSYGPDAKELAEAYKAATEPAK